MIFFFALLTAVNQLSDKWMLLITRNYCIFCVVETLYAGRIVTLNCFAYQQKWRSVVHLLPLTIVLEGCSVIAGKWTAISALDYGMPVTLIGESVFARCLSSLKVRKWRRLIIKTLPRYFILTSTQNTPCPKIVTFRNELSFAFKILIGPTRPLQ